MKKDQLKNVSSLLREAELTKRAIESLDKKLRRVKREVPLSAAERMKAWRARNRSAAVPPNHTCPCCGVIKLKSRQWVCTGPRAVCKSCFMKGER